MGLDKLSKTCGQDIAIFTLNWLALQGLDVPHQYKSDIKRQEYISTLRKQYNKKELADLGFDALCEIDNTYHMLSKDLYLLLEEIDNERLKTNGIKMHVKINIQ